MNCYECERDGNPMSAVAICKNCGVGLCMYHLAMTQANRPGGTELGCPHILPAPNDVDSTTHRMRV
jgi:hypothetical protein